MEIKKKLRDVTYGEYIEWKDKNCGNKNCGSCRNCIFSLAFCIINKNYCWALHKEKYSDRFLNQEIVIDEELLPCWEKNFLSEVIKPFKNNIVSLGIIEGIDDIHIKVLYKHDKFDALIQIIFPSFDNDYFSKMEVGKEYTLEELGLC